MSSFSQLMLSLRTAKLEDLGGAVAALVSVQASSLRDLAADVARQVERSSELASGARETTTHYVWPLMSNWNGAAGLYVHEYKNPGELRSGYADSIHDHRYDFASLILSGGYREVRYKVSDAGCHTDSTLASGTQKEYWAGDIIKVENRVFHRVADLRPKTLTLLIKLPPVKDHSTSFDRAAGRWVKHYPAEVRVPRLLQTLREIGEGDVN